MQSFEFHRLVEHKFAKPYEERARVKPECSVYLHSLRGSQSGSIDDFVCIVFMLSTRPAVCTPYKLNVSPRLLPWNIRINLSFVRGSANASNGRWSPRNGHPFLIDRTAGLENTIGVVNRLRKSWQTFAFSVNREVFISIFVSDTALDRSNWSVCKRAT